MKVSKLLLAALAGIEGLAVVGLLSLHFVLGAVSLTTAVAGLVGVSILLAPGYLFAILKG